MPRKIPECPPKCPDKSKITGSCKHKEYNIDVVTPIFGGGVEAGKNDLVTVVRGSSIRGHLRFWWRATKGAIYQDEQALREREGDIWGTAKKASKVAVQVEVTNKSEEEACAKIEGKNPKPVNGYPGYAIFPFYTSNKKIDIKKVTSNVKFKLTLDYPEDIEQDVLAAVWAWVNFGGIGARTRRGCGSLYCSDFSPELKQGLVFQKKAKFSSTDNWKASWLADWYQKKLNEYCIKLVDATRYWSTLPKSFFVISDENNNNPIKSWKTAIDTLKKFRQNDGAWPETDILKRIFAMSETDVESEVIMDSDSFSKAQFGLPIIFRSKDEEMTAILEPLDKKRMSSPLILKPLAFSETQAIPIAMKLNTCFVTEATLTFREQRHFIDEQKLRSPKNSHVKTHKKGSALDAFITFAQGREKYK